MDVLGFAPDLNLIPLDDPMHEAVNEVSSNYRFIIASHGVVGRLVKKEPFYTIKEIADIVKKSGKKEILVLACEQGPTNLADDDTDKVSDVEKLANYTGLPVTYTRHLARPVRFNIGNFTFGATFALGLPFISPAWETVYPNK